MDAREIRYLIPPGVEAGGSNGRLWLSTPQGGRVMVDRPMQSLWQTAQGRSLSETLAQFHDSWATPLQLRGGLACLAEAGLLARDIQQPPPRSAEPVRGELVSIVIVSYNSQTWLEDCLSSIDAQTYSPIETILVDNGSQDGSADWVAQRRPDIQLIRLEQTQPLARAINSGIQSGRGSYFFLLNPDVRLAPDAVSQLVRTALGHPRCGAVAAKLRLMWTPAFLNGIGNLVGPISWGTDLGLGNLDLGQFDGWRELPSACFAAALIPTQALKAIGPLDEQFPMYYEDSEWCYRARLFGYTILACPQAEVLHAFSSKQAGSTQTDLSPAKLRRVVFGRLNFITKINGPMAFLRFLSGYFAEDLARTIFSILRRHTDLAKAHLLGWMDYLQALPDLRKTRRLIQSRRRLNDRGLYGVQKKAPSPMILDGMPTLTWDALCARYLPLMLAGKTRELPELDGVPSGERNDLPLCQSRWGVTRAANIWRNEGLRALLRRFLKDLQWTIMCS